MTKSRVYGVRNRRKGALERLVVQKEQLEKQEKKVPKRIDKEIDILKTKLKLIQKWQLNQLVKKEVKDQKLI